jgi:MFS transporter, PHS family, inorganic phosphate transporter
MVTAAIGSALSPSSWVLIGFRFLLGFGAGGDYPVSAVLMSEYANRKDRGKLVGSQATAK